MSFEEMGIAFAKALSKNPLIYTMPTLLANIKVIAKNEEYYLLDAENKEIQLFAEADKAWRIIALSGGQNINIFGEWNGKGLVPFSVFTANRVVGLN